MVSKKIPLTSQVRDLFIVIRKNQEFPKHIIKELCDEKFDKYAFIEHKRDKEPITGLIEGVHYHIWCHVAKKGVPKSQHINEICEKLKLKDSDGICIEQIVDKIKAIQYLTHQNFKEKTRHEVSEIVTNLPKEQFELMMTSDTKEVVSFDLIYTLCMCNQHISGVIKALGVTQYRVYRNVVWDIWNDLKSEKTKKLLLEKEVTIDKAIDL